MSDPMRPDPSEYAPFYARYVAQVPDGRIVDILDAQIGDTLDLVRGLDALQALHRYAPGKWSIKEVLAHLADAERIFAYRALRFARGDATSLPGFDENLFAAASGADTRPLAELADEFSAVRRATIALGRGLAPEALLHRGSANGFEVSVRALLYVAAGHELHHLQVLRDRYLTP